MKSNMALGIAGLGIILATAPLFAHHSFTALYNTDKTVSIEGKLTQFMFRNPHSFVHVDVKEETGATTRYAIEWAGAAQLNRDGVGSAALRPGDYVIVTGNPGRNPEDHRLRMIKLKRTGDNYTWGTKPGETFD